MTLKVTDQNFDQEVLKATKPVIVDFWAEWCGPCRMLSPLLDELAQENEGKVIIGKVNVDENPGIAGQYSIRSIPTLMLFKNGQMLGTQVGLVPKQRLQEWINSHL
jgi:thioredoxin 1